MDLPARKRKLIAGADDKGATPAKIPASTSPAATEDDGINALERLLKWLEEEEARSGSIRGHLPDSVTINGDEETCGSSFSAAAATVMAGVDGRGMVGMGSEEAAPYFVGSGAPAPEMVRTAAEVEEGLIAGGRMREGERVEEWVERVLLNE